jgi:hypothetical protein
LPFGSCQAKGILALIWNISLLCVNNSGDPQTKRAVHVMDLDFYMSRIQVVKLPPPLTLIMNTLAVLMYLSLCDIIAIDIDWSAAFQEWKNVQDR